MAAIGKKLRSLQGGRVAFWCPGCDGAHQVGVDGSAPHAQGPVWSWNGDGDKPTFAPSIFVNPPGPGAHPTHPSCHSFVTDGKIAFGHDCTHALAGQTVDLPDFDAELD